MSNYWSNEEFIEVVKKSKTISEVIAYFGLPKNQGHYNRIFHKSVKELNLNISHLREGAKLQNFNKGTALEDLLVKGTFKSTSTLRKRLIKDGALTLNCYECNLQPLWNGKKLTFHLDHINGDNTDNRIENLRLLCPNCHSQTETYCGAKSKKEKHAYKFVCRTCGGPKKYSKSENCTKCAKRLNHNGTTKTKIEWPKPEIVLQMSKDLGLAATGRKLGVSDNAVRKFLKRSDPTYQ